MSRVGKNSISIPSGVECGLVDGRIQAKGQKGQLSFLLSKDVTVDIKDAQVHVQPKSEAKASRMMWGTTQRLVRNLIQGVSEGFTKVLEISGVGYRAQVQGNKLVLQLGYSHDLEVPIPSDLTVVCAKPTEVAISGANLQKVGQFAAEIRRLRPPEPYKGKGVKYKGEYILRKEGKKK
jgi:large subunit ribosomal protein L6